MPVTPFPILKDDCECGHDRGHHFDRKHNCLAVHCECKVFVEPSRVRRRVLPAANYPTPPDPYKNKPHVDTLCTCAACQAWMRQRVYGP